MLVPVELVVFIAGLIVALLGSMMSIQIHLLIRILSKQTAFELRLERTDMRVSQVEKETVTA